MKSKAVLAAAGAAIVGLVMLFLYMDRFEEEASGGDAVQVLIASQDIPLGSSLATAMVAVHEIPEAYIEDRHVLATDHDRVMGVRVVSTVRAGESLLWTDLATSSDTSRDLSGLVRAGCARSRSRRTRPRPSAASCAPATGSTCSSPSTAGSPDGRVPMARSSA
jgi:pilus assembly protein CpaB